MNVDLLFDGFEPLFVFVYSVLFELRVSALSVWLVWVG